MSDELPEGWAETTLAELLRSGLFVDGDWVESKDQDPNGDVRLVQLADVGEGVFRDKSARFLTPAKASELSCTFLAKGDVLIARMPEPLGRACIFPGDRKQSVTVVDVCIARPSANVAEPRWLMHFINAPQFRTSMAEFEKGTTRKRISRSNLGQLVIRVPPLAEQRRIVAKVDALVARVNVARERLEKVPLLLKQFRQAVLAKAFRGELVPTEAELAAREGRSFLSAAELLGHPPDALSDELPEGWTSTEASKVCLKVQSGGTPKAGFVTEGIPFLKVYNIVDDQVSFERRRQFVASETHTGELKKSCVLPGDVLMNIVGPPLNKVAIVPASIQKANINQAIVLFRPGPAVTSSWLYYWLLTGESVRSLQFETKGSAGQVNISLSQCRSLLFPVAPLDEQRRIVAKVDALLAAAAKVEAEAERLVKELERAPQAILMKAFSGELVPTEAELARIEARAFEPAAVLLALISQTAGGAERATPLRGRAGRSDSAQAASVRRLSRAARSR